MARGRMLSTLIAEDAKFNKMSMEAQFMFMRTIPHLDRDGLINGHPFILHGKVAPLMPQIAPMLDSIIDEWIKAGMVINYNDDDTHILFFKSFAKNQIGMRYDRESPSTFPPPPGYERTKDGLQPITDTPKIPPSQTPLQPNGYYPQESGKSPARVRQESGITPPECEVEVKEKGREDRTREATAVPIEESPPPFLGGDPFLDTATYRFNRKKKTGSQAKRGGAWPEIDQKCPPSFRLPLVEKLIDIHGLRALIDDAEDDNKLADMHQMAADLYAMGYATTEGIEIIYSGWKVDWKNKMPGGRQFVQFASTRKCNMAKPPPDGASQQTANGNTIISQSGGGMIVQGDITKMYQQR